VVCAAFPAGAQEDGRAQDDRRPHAATPPLETTGLASWYGGKFQGRLTANGEIFDTNKLTAAHKWLPFNTRVKVSNPANGRSVIVRINDRGPFVAGRIIDLSRAAAESIGMTGAGVALVHLEVLEMPQVSAGSLSRASGPKETAPPQASARTIQVASFSSEANARAAVATLTANKIDAEIEVATSGHNRVVVRNVPQSSVDSLRVRLAALGFHNVLIRQQ